MSNAKKRFVKRNAGVIMVAVIVGVFASGGAFLWNLDRDPVVNISTHTSPSPNAFDDYMRAGDLLKNRNEIAPPRRRGVPRTILSRAAQTRILADNAPALAAFRIGLPHTYRAPATREYSDISKYLDSEECLVRLLALQSNAQASRGDWAASAQTSLDGMQLGEDVPRGGGFLYLDSGISISKIARSPLLRAIPHLDLTELRSALLRLHAIDSGAQPFVSTLQEEKWDTQSSLMAEFQKPNWRTSIINDSGLSVMFWLVKMDWKTRVTRALTSKRRVMDDYSQYMNRAIADDRTYHSMWLPGDVEADPILPVLVPVFFGYPTEYYNNRTQNAFLETELALRHYKLRHHAYPETLTVLTSDLFSGVLDDPFTIRQSLRYRQNGKSYELYSVGPDGVDDGGKAINDPSQRPARRRLVNFLSKGDIVAGVNF